MNIYIQTLHIKKIKSMSKVCSICSHRTIFYKWKNNKVVCLGCDKDEEMAR